MKIVISLAIVALVAVGVLAITKEQKQKVVNAMVECLRGRRISMGQIIKLVQRNFTDLQPDTGCFVNCALEKMEFLKNGVMQDAVFIEKFTKVGSKKEDVLQFLKACKDQKGADNCETAIKIYKCFTRQKVSKI